MFAYLNSFIFRNEILDNMVYFLAETLPYILFGAAFLFLLWVPTKKDHPKYMWAMPRRALKCVHAAFAVGISFLITEAIKYVAHVSRPFEGPNGIHSLFLHSEGDSFPSGHATAFAALATIMYFHNRSAGILFWIGAILIAVSRVVAGVHYPIDVAVGIMIGAFVGFLFNRLWKKISIATTY